MNPEVLTLKDLTFEVRRSQRRRTIAISVGRQGELSIYAPDTVTQVALVRNAQKKLLWVHRKLAEKEVYRIPQRQPSFVSGEPFSFLGRNYRLRLVDNQSKPLDFNGEYFLLRQNERRRAQEHFKRWYREHGLPWLKKRVVLLAKRVGASPMEIKVRDIGYRWGSCGKSGNVYFHWKLLQLPVRLVDYVIIHELAHLTEGNHGKDFWRRVERAMPDWRQRKEELSERGDWNGFSTQDNQ